MTSRPSTRCVVLLRGVNVGGHNRVPMADFRALCEDAGAGEVRTYVQSGNAVLTWPGTSAELERAVVAGLTERLGVSVAAMARTAAELAAVAAACPWPDLDPKLLHVGFCADQPDLGGFTATPPERVAVGDRALYLFHAGGVQRSGLARLKPGTDVTARNWRTVTALLELAR